MRKLACCVCGHTRKEEPKYVRPDVKQKKNRTRYKVWSKIGRCNMCSTNCERWHKSERPGVCAFHGDITN